MKSILYGAAHSSHEGRNWSRYADRVASYAFSMAGNMAMAQTGDLVCPNQMERLEKEIKKTEEIRIKVC